MNYYSLHHKSPKTTFKNAVIEGLAKDRGIYFPESITPLSKDFIDNITDYSNHEIAYEAIKQFVGDEIPTEKLKEIIANTVSFDFPVVKVDENIGALELFHGPTFAFKDYAMQFLSRAFNQALKKRNKRGVILGATSGDTGSAALEAFKGQENIDIFILFPHQRVSEVQQKQMTYINEPGAYALSVKSDFDGCQSIVKDCFEDLNFLDKRYGQEQSQKPQNERSHLGLRESIEFVVNNVGRVGQLDGQWIAL